MLAQPSHHSMRVESLSFGRGAQLFYRATCCATSFTLCVCRSTRSYMFFLTLCEDRSGSPKRPLHRDFEDILPDAVGGSYPQIP